MNRLCPPNPPHVQAGFLCFFLTVAHGDALANFTRLESTMVSALETVTESPQSQSSLVRNPPLSRKHMDFGKHPNNCKQICWNPCHVYKSEMREAWKGYFRNGENTLFYVQRHVRLIVILPLNNLHVCWGTKCSNVVASTPLGCLKIHWPQKSAIKMLQINATTKTVLSYNKNHSLLDSIILVGWKLQWIPFHSSTWLK